MADATPQIDRKALAYKIGTVFGQRSQLFPNLPITDSFEFFGVMYDLSKQQIKERSEELIKIFSLEDFKSQPVRKLSLGQRMRAEIAASLIHKPKVIFLDEPTIGLDVVAKKALRELLIKINKEEKTTIFLTSHDVGDIESLCERTIIINHGTIVKDLPTNELGKSFVHEKYLDIILEKAPEKYPELPKRLKASNLYNEIYVVSYVLLPSKLHIVLKQRSSDSISKFMKQLINAYSTYYNKKYKQKIQIKQLYTPLQGLGA